MSTWIKICGITRRADAEAVVAAGADALGINFAARSPRRVGIGRAREIADATEGRITRVGVFVDAPPGEIESVLAEVPLDVLQFHGDESGAACRRYGKPYLKALRVRAPLAMATLEAEYADAMALLLDAFVPGQSGGTGRCFDWTLFPRRSTLPLVLAGGLEPGNVAAAVRELRPWGVDAAGGVEAGVPGEKDAARIQQFVDEVRCAGS
ncbi:MAG: phosphoribosylanthranilate isomerase [Pseudomonadales bacterium]